MSVMNSAELIRRAYNNPEDYENKRLLYYALAREGYKDDSFIIIRNQFYGTIRIDRGQDWHLYIVYNYVDKLFALRLKIKDFNEFNLFQSSEQKSLETKKEEIEKLLLGE